VISPMLKNTSEDSNTGIRTPDETPKESQATHTPGNLFSGEAPLSNLN
jgi:hypothetical protein